MSDPADSVIPITVARDAGADAGILLAVGVLTPGPIVPLTTVIVTIDVPAPNSQVPGGGTFYSYGFVSPTNSTMTAWIDDNGTIYNGKKSPPLPHSPPYQWGFKFTNIPTGHAVQLTVQGASGGSTGFHTITITPV